MGAEGLDARPTRRSRENDLLGDLAKAKGDHERAIDEAAVSDAERERLRAEADRADRSAQRTRTTAVKAAARGRIECETAQAARRALPRPKSEAGMPCPHCGAFVAIRRISLVETTLDKVEPIPPAELKRRRQRDRRGRWRDLATATARCSATRSAVERARRDLDASTAARVQLAALPARVKSPAGQLEETRAAVEAAEARLKGWRQKREADRLRDEISVNEKILDVLAGDGLRAKKLARVLDVFNSATLKPLTDIAGWKPVAIEADMSLTYGGRRYPLLSTSEQYRVRVVLQVAMDRPTAISSSSTPPMSSMRRRAAGCLRCSPPRNCRRWSA